MRFLVAVDGGDVVLESCFAGKRLVAPVLRARVWALFAVDGGDVALEGAFHRECYAAALLFADVRLFVAVDNLDVLVEGKSVGKRLAASIPRTG